jgi:hypothetical protein
MDTSRLLSGVQTQLRPLATVGPDTGTPGRPFWIAAEPDDPDPEYMIPLRNGLLDVSGEKPRLMKSNPRVYASSSSADVITFAR